MENCVVNNVNFRANYLTGAKIFRKELGKIIPEDVQLLEMDLKNKADTDALEKIKSSWVGAEFAQMLPTSWYSDKVKIYVLSNQKSNYESPVANDIKAFASVSLDKPKVTLKFLQVDPKIINDSERKLYGFGRELINKLVDMFHNIGYKSMDVYSMENVRPFYERLKFIPKPCTQESSTNFIREF